MCSSLLKKLSNSVLLLFCIAMFGCSINSGNNPNTSPPIQIIQSNSSELLEKTTTINTAVNISTVDIETPAGTMKPELSELEPRVTETMTRSKQETPTYPPDAAKADVISVEVNGSPGSYTFFVGVRSPDLGCEQYADWWEVVDGSGRLVYRRILLHSHVSEQPFVRSGGPVEVEPETELVVRAHMNHSGYGGEVMSGSVASGFHPAQFKADFSAELETSPPLPDGCAF